MSSNDNSATGSGPQAHRDAGGMLLAALMIVIAALAWWDTTTMADADSFVFPRAVIVVMVACCLLIILIGLARPKPDGVAGIDDGSGLRRMLLVLSMAASAALMPFIGFILSGLIVFALLLMVAMYDPWTPFRIIVYPLSGAAIVIGFYFLFGKLLAVPLPVGSLFTWTR